VVIIENPFPEGPFGAKDRRAPIDGPAPALVNAIRSIGIDCANSRHS